MYQDDEQQERFFIDLSKMINALKQQTLNPQILPFQSQSFQNLQLAVKEQDQRIKQFIQSAPDDSTHQQNFRQIIYRSQTQKISYIIKQYLRVRIAKIEKYAFYLIKNNKVAEQSLSQHELTHLEKYAQLKYKFLQQNILKNLVKAYRGLGGMETHFSKINEIKLQVDSKQSKIDLVAPDMSQYCFAQIKSNPDLSLRYNYDIKAENVSGQQVISTNSIVYTQYKNVKDLIAKDNAALL